MGEESQLYATIHVHVDDFEKFSISEQFKAMRSLAIEARNDLIHKIMDEGWFVTEKIKVISRLEFDEFMLFRAIVWGSKAS